MVRGRLGPRRPSVRFRLVEELPDSRLTLTGLSPPLERAGDPKEEPLAINEWFVGGLEQLAVVWRDPSMSDD